MGDESNNDNGKQPPAGGTVNLDEHRGLAAQKATDVRRSQSNIRADQKTLRESQASLEEHLFAGPAATWSEAAEKCAYLLHLFAGTSDGRDPRYKQMIAGALEDLKRLKDDAPKASP